MATPGVLKSILCKRAHSLPAFSGALHAIAPLWRDAFGACEYSQRRGGGHRPRDAEPVGGEP
jgi:hypothetical protein